MGIFSPGEAVGACLDRRVILDGAEARVTVTRSMVEVGERGRAAQDKNVGGRKGLCRLEDRTTARGWLAGGWYSFCCCWGRSLQAAAAAAASTIRSRCGFFFFLFFFFLPLST